MVILFDQKGEEMKGEKGRGGDLLDDWLFLPLDQSLPLSLATSPQYSNAQQRKLYVTQ